jgi:hypothetical protein
MYLSTRLIPIQYSLLGFDINVDKILTAAEMSGLVAVDA